MHWNWSATRFGDSTFPAAQTRPVKSITRVSELNRTESLGFPIPDVHIIGLNTLVCSWAVVSLSFVSSSWRKSGSLWVCRLNSYFWARLMRSRIESGMTGVFFNDSYEYFWVGRRWFLIKLISGYTSNSASGPLGLNPVSRPIARSLQTHMTLLLGILPSERLTSLRGHYRETLWPEHIPYGSHRQCLKSFESRPEAIY